MNATDTDPAEAAAKALCPLSPERAIAATWKREAAQVIRSHYCPLLEQARDALEGANLRLEHLGSEETGECEATRNVQSALVALNRAIGEEPTK